MSNWTEAQLQTGREIIAIARKYLTIPPLLHLAVCIQECGLDSQAIGDNGQSFGPHQLYQQVHPDTAFVATNPWYDYGYPEVRSRWEQTYLNLGGDAAWADVGGRLQFLAAFAPAAQGSIAWTDLLAGQRYDDAVGVMEAVS